MARTLYLSYDGMTDPLGQSQVIPYLRGLSEAGHRISLISFEKAERADRVPFIASLMKEYGIDWHPMAYTKRPPVLSTLKDIWAMYRKAVALHKHAPFALVHCRSYISALVGLRLKRKFGMKFIFDMRGFWADERIDGNIWSLESPVFRNIYRFFKKKELEFLSNADYTISLTHSAERIIHGWPLPKQPIPIAVIPCCADLGLFVRPSMSARAASVRTEFGFSEGQLVLSYLGSIGTWYMLPEMMRFFKYMKEAHANAHFFFITAEDAKPILEEAQRHGIATADLTIRKANREQVPYFLSASDLSIFFIRPTFSKQASSPTKQGELMGMGIPVVCNTGVGDTDYVVEKYQSGILVSDFDEASLKAAVGNIPQALALDKAKIAQGAQEFYSLEEGVRRYLRVYERVLGGLSRNGLEVEQ